MSNIVSSDGTRIAYERRGSGAPVLLVDGALCYRESGPMKDLAELLSPRYTVYTYDRRGRGESGDTRPYAVEREVEDIEALIREIGGSAYVYGTSSGAALALEAASRIGGIRKLALFEAPFIVDDTAPARPEGYLANMQRLVDTGRRAEAVSLFMRTVGVPAFGVWMMRLMPVWKKLVGVAHTLPYDFMVLGDTGSGKPLPTARWQGATIPTLVMDGGKSPVSMRNAMRSLAGVLPNATYRTLEGQTHVLKPQALVPVLNDFFVD